LRNQGINPSKCLSDSKQDQLYVYVSYHISHSICHVLRYTALQQSFFSCLLIIGLIVWYSLDGKNKTYRPFSQADYNRMVNEKVVSHILVFALSCSFIMITLLNRLILVRQVKQVNIAARRKHAMPLHQLQLLHLLLFKVNFKLSSHHINYHCPFFIIPFPLRPPSISSNERMHTRTYPHLIPS
jgi:hypothetical protein